MPALEAERSLVTSCLPTEAQWEYAARGNIARDCPTCYGEPARPAPARSPYTVARHQVGISYTVDELPATPVCERRGMSPFGLHHMAGNVWQWCRDWYAPDFYQRPEASLTNPCNAEPTSVRSERGGSWVGPAELAHLAHRRGRPQAARGRCLGFRCVGFAEDLD